MRRLGVEARTRRNRSQSGAFATECDRGLEGTTQRGTSALEKSSRSPHRCVPHTRGAPAPQSRPAARTATPYALRWRRWADGAPSCSVRDEGALRLRRGAAPPSPDAGVRRRASTRTSRRAMRAMRGCPRACVHAARARPRCRWRRRRGLEALQPQSAPGVHVLAQVQHDDMAARGAEGVFRGVGGAAVEGRLSCPLACRAARSRCGTHERAAAAAWGDDCRMPMRHLLRPCCG